MKTIKELFKKFWDLEWLNYEEDIRGFSFKFYKEGYEQNKKDVLGLIDEIEGKLLESWEGCHPKSDEPMADSTIKAFEELKARSEG